MSRATYLNDEQRDNHATDWNDDDAYDFDDAYSKPITGRCQHPF